MSRIPINYGTTAGDGTGDPLFNSFKNTDDNFIELYSYHTEASGFESRSDTTTEPSQTPATDNPFLVTTNPESNGGISLIDALGNITPRAVGDVLSIDVAFTTIVPVGSNLYSVVKLIVNGVVYRAVTQNIVKGVGLDDYFSVSWTVPVGADFHTYGGTIYVNPISALLIKDRYIQVTQIHKTR
jgi:hypothetical protein